MNGVVEQVLRDPRARLYYDEIGQALQREQLARKRFRDAYRDGEKAEFINGEVVVHSPAKLEHLKTVTRTLRLLSTFADHHKAGLAMAEKALVTLTRNDYEPDVCFWHTQKAAQFKQGQLEFPAPDLVVEVLSPSTEKADRGTKFEDYAAHGVDEYWILDPIGRVAEQYARQGTSYVPVPASGQGQLRSTVLPDLEIPVAALFDDAENLAALRRIVTG
jgi:Uma2 family endonuclease